jgi:hypothetical protein
MAAATKVYLAVGVASGRQKFFIISSYSLALDAMTLGQLFSEKGGKDQEMTGVYMACICSMFGSTGIAGKKWGKGETRTREVGGWLGISNRKANYHKSSQDN